MIRIHVEVYIACMEIVPRIQGEFPNIACQLLQCELFSFTVAGLPALAAAMTHPDFGDDSTRSVPQTMAHVAHATGCVGRDPQLPPNGKAYPQDAGYREAVLPADIAARVAVEALHEDCWHKFVGLSGRIVGMTSFGESAPGGELMEHFGFTVDNVVETVRELV